MAISRGGVWLTEKSRLRTEGHGKLLSDRRRVPWSDLHFSKITSAVVIIARIINTLFLTNISNDWFSFNLPNSMGYIYLLLCIPTYFVSSSATCVRVSTPSLNPNLIKGKHSRDTWAPSQA